MNTIERIQQIAEELKVNLKVDKLKEDIHYIEPYDNGDTKLYGMQITQILNNGSWEVSEFQAGPQEKDLYIYGEYVNLKSAIKSMLRGNWTTGRKPIQVWEG